MQLLSKLNSLDNVADGSTRKLLKTATSSGSGNAVTAVSISGDTLTYTKGSSFALSNHTHDDANTTAAGFMSAADKIKLNGIADGATATTDYYGICDTPAGTQKKTVDCAGFTLVDGVHIRVLFANAQTYNGVASLNVNGTGDITIQYKQGTNAVRYMWNAGEIIDFTYNGSNWIMHNTTIATTTYYGLTKLTGGATSTATNTALTPASLNNLALYMISGYPVYSTSSTYAVGDRVRYGYYTYECNTAITTAEAWTAAHWTALDPLQKQVDEKSTVSFTQTQTSGTEIGSITIDGTTTKLYAQSSGGADVSFTQTQTSGVQVGTITINGTDTKLFSAPKVHQYYSNIDDLYPLLFRYNNGITSTASSMNFSRFANNLYVNPKVGALYATSFYRNGTELGDASIKGVDYSITSSSTSTNLPTTAAVVNLFNTIANGDGVAY